MSLPESAGNASLASRRWGPAVGGWLVGLPLTSGPIAFFLAVDQGGALPQPRPQDRLPAPPRKPDFCAAYGRAARRFSWSVAFSAGTGAFVAGVILLDAVQMPLWALMLMVQTTLAAALALPPRLPPDLAQIPAPARWDLPARMLVATMLVVTLTSAAPLLGARLAGMLATFPVSALWIPGVILGIEFVVHGCSLMGFSLDLRKVHREVEAELRPPEAIKRAA